MFVIGIDPGIDKTGYAVVEINKGTEYLREYGVIRTKAKKPLPERLLILHRDLEQILQRHPYIKLAGVEQLFFAKNTKTAFMVGQARGVILFTLCSKNLTIKDVTPAHLKQVITGNGRATKKEMQKMLMLRLRLSSPPASDDAADAIAIAIATAAETKFLSL